MLKREFLLNLYYHNVEYVETHYIVVLIIRNIISTINQEKFELLIEVYYEKNLDLVS